MGYYFWNCRNYGWLKMAQWQIICLRQAWGYKINPWHCLSFFIVIQITFLLRIPGALTKCLTFGNLLHTPQCASTVAKYVWPWSSRQQQNQKEGNDFKIWAREIVYSKHGIYSQPTSVWSAAQHHLWYLECHQDTEQE